MFKAVVLSSFILATAAIVKTGYAELLHALDLYVIGGYGRLSETGVPELQQTGQEITQQYAQYRQHD